MTYQPVSCAPLRDERTRTASRRNDRNDVGQCRYTDISLGWIEVCSRLRATGMSVAGICRYAALVRADWQRNQARQLLEAHYAHVEACQAELVENLKLIDDKIGVYRDHLATDTANQLWSADSASTGSAGGSLPYARRGFRHRSSGRGPNRSQVAGNVAKHRDLAVRFSPRLSDELDSLRHHTFVLSAKVIYSAGFPTIGPPRQNTRCISLAASRSTAKFAAPPRW